METEDGDGIVVDLSGVNETGNFPVIPRGIYSAEVDSLEYDTAKSSGNKMWTWKFKINDGGEFDGRTFFYHTVFSEGGMPRVKRTLARLKDAGENTGYAKSLLGGPFSPSRVADEGRLLLATCRIRVDIKPYEGQKRNNIKDVLSPLEDGSGGAGGFAAV
jgi:hypothetical protein